MDVVGGKAVGARRTAERRRRREQTEAQPPTEALLTLLAHALELDRAALLLEDSPGGRLAPAAVHGPAALRAGELPDESAWSLILPIRRRGRTIGYLLLHRPTGAPLAPAEATLAERIGDGIAQIVENGQLLGELTYYYGPEYRDAGIRVLIEPNASGHCVERGRAAPPVWAA